MIVGHAPGADPGLPECGEPQPGECGPEAAGCAAPKNVIYIIFTDKTCIEKVCVSRCRSLSGAEARFLWRLWWHRRCCADPVCRLRGRYRG